MYRRDYPDVPGLFDARFSEYNRPSLLREFQNTWVISLIGIVMVGVGGGVLFWNEGRAVRTAVSLEEGLRDVLVPETIDVVFEENSGKLVLLAGKLAITDSLTDHKYAIAINAVKLRKVVQVYQWHEIEDKSTGQNAEGGDHDGHTETTYSYDKDWFEYHIDSSSFAHTMGHHNPHLDSWPANSSLTTNSRVKIGDFLLGKGLKDKFEDFKPFTSDQRSNLPGVRIHAGMYYHSLNVWQPDVGDYRIQFTYAGRHGDEVTCVGKQAGREVRPYQTMAGDELLIMQQGIRGQEEVFRTEHNHNRTATWIYRLVGWFVMFLGFTCLNSIIQMACDLYPTLGRMVTLGVASVNFSVSMSVTLTIIGAGWVWFRPVLGLSLIFIASVPIIVPAIRILLRQNAERAEHATHRS